MDYTIDKLSIKNLLFTKAIPNHEIPFPVNGHKIFWCTDCGDKFIFESSYEYHVNRKSVKITYTCRSCTQTLVFYNRCSFLSHIRSHAFKTATISVGDLKLEPLPLTFFNIRETQTSSDTPQNKEASKKTPVSSCYECKKNLLNVSSVCGKNRAHHFMQYTNEFHSCPICLFTLPTECGLRAHIRLHLNIPPFFCPECGIPLPNKSIRYPFGHDCEGFKMMRATSRLICPVTSCPLLHPNEFKEHMKTLHLKKVYKCPFCAVACFNTLTIEKHLQGHNSDISKALIFHQCEICPGRLVIQKHVDNHILSHASYNAFPCRSCGLVAKTVINLLNHYIEKHTMTPPVENILKHFIQSSRPPASKAKRVYRVVKRCEQCKRNFTYKCKYNEIPVLPNECPFQCTSKLTSKSLTNKKTSSKKDEIKCNLCKVKISGNWEDIKKHYSKEHKSHQCLDAKLSIKRLSIKECMKLKKKKTAEVLRRLRSRKRSVGKINDADQKSPVEESPVVNQISEIENTKEPEQTTAVTTATATEYKCFKCGFKCESKEILESHITDHRDPCMAYQCMECGQSFVVKPSFSKHLLLEHNISDVDDYICKKQCYNENALEKYQSKKSNEPLKENQCKICAEEFNNPDDMQKHFRGHGMAFLLKSTGNKG